MKKSLLSALAMSLIAVVAQAQIGGVSISPAGAGPGDDITFTVWVDQTCPTPAANPAKTLANAPGPIRLHSGVTNAAAAGWQHVISANPADPADPGPGTSVTGFVNNGNGTWSKTIRATDYYAQPASDILGINFVINGGDEVGGSVWDNEGKNDDGSGTNTCADFYVAFPVDPAFVSVKKHVNNGVFTVSQNAPNPVAGSTNIRFFLNRPENVSVRVTNILGETVKTLHSGKMSAGQQTLTWNANGANSGIYFYTIEAGNAVETRKMIVK